jgi:glycosyltransferase involved in cell wall biosynthesis
MSELRVVHVCAYDRGGAANAALRLHRDLLATGVDSQMVVATKTVSDSTVHEVPGVLHRLIWPHVHRIDYHLGHFWCGERRRFSGLSAIPGFAASFIESLQPDIVHLHWVAHSFLSIGQIGRIPHPVVWTLHDLWPLTPGYGYRIEAGDALPGIDPFLPLLPMAPYQRLAQHIWNRKLRDWRAMNSVVVGPSRWISEEAKRSAVFKGREIHTIPYSVPLDVFHPSDRIAAREILRLPKHGPLILFGADRTSPRKGPDLFEQALERIPPAQGHADDQRPTIVLFGRESRQWLRDCRFAVIRFDAITDMSRVAKLYAACDVFVCPSREDNLPNTVIESLACGTPVVGFRIGGLPDMVQHEVNGMLAAPFDTDELARGIVAAIASERAEGTLGRNARSFAEERYGPEKTSLEYLKLYRTLFPCR